MPYRPSTLRRGDLSSALVETGRKIDLPEGSELKKAYIDVVGREVVDPTDMKKPDEVQGIWFECWAEQFGNKTINVRYKGTIDDLRANHGYGEFVLGTIEYTGAGIEAMAHGAFSVRRENNIYQDTASATQVISIGTMFGVAFSDEGSMDRIIEGLEESHPRAAAKGDPYDG